MEGLLVRRALSVGSYSIQEEGSPFELVNNAVKASTGKELSSEAYRQVSYVNDISFSNEQVLMERAVNGSLGESVTGYSYGMWRESYSVEAGTGASVDMGTGSGTYYYTGTGSVANLVSGGKTISYAYDTGGGRSVYGAENTVLYTRTQATGYGYNGEYTHESLGVQYLRARYLNMATGTFLSRDTYGGTMNNILSQNRYTYVRNNPVNYADPDRHKAVGTTIKNIFSAMATTTRKAAQEAKNQTGRAAEIAVARSGNGAAAVSMATNRITRNEVNGIKQGTTQGATAVQSAGEKIVKAPWIESVAAIIEKRQCAAYDYCENVIQTFIVLCKKKMEKNFIILENKADNTSRFQQVEEVTVPYEEDIKTYLSMTTGEIEKITGNTINEEKNITVFSYEDSYKGLYLDNSSFYFLCAEDETIETPVFLAFYGKYHDKYLKTLELSKDMDFKKIMAQWGEAEIEESGAGNEHHYRIQYEKKGLIYSFVSDNKEGDAFRTYIELSDDLNADLYDKCLHKIWIPQEWGENIHLVHDTGFSINICEIKGNVVEGKIATKALINLPCFYNSITEYSQPVFSGTISGNTIEGSFCDEYGNEGKFRLVLKNENEIEAAFEYVNNDLDEELLSLNGNYILRPYNMKDEKQVTMHHRKKVYLNSWGYVYLTSGKLDTEMGTVGTAFLTDFEGNIFYEFGLPFHYGTQITDVYTKDINGDGLMDVVLYEFFEVGNENNRDWNVLQRKDGLFYSFGSKE